MSTSLQQRELESGVLVVILTLIVHIKWLHETVWCGLHVTHGPELRCCHALHSNVNSHRGISAPSLPLQHEPPRSLTPTMHLSSVVLEAKLREPHGCDLGLDQDGEREREMEGKRETE